MTYRLIDSEIWADPWYEGLSSQEKLLFVYLFTNNSCNQAGVIIQFSSKRVAFETGLEKNEVERIMKFFEESGKVIVEGSRVACVAFTEHQVRNGNFAVSASKAIDLLPEGRMKQVLLDRKARWKQPKPNGKQPSSNPPTGQDRTGQDSTAKEKEKDIPSPHENEEKTPACPHEEIIKLYHEILPELPKVRVWNEDSRKQLRARWKEAQEMQDLKWWRSFFTEVRSCPFLMGQNNDGWKAALGWLILPKNLSKVVNGFYHNRVNSSTTKPQNPNQPRQQTVNGKPCNSAYGYTWGETKDDMPPIAPPPGMKWEKIIEPYDGCSLGYKAVPC